MITLSLYYHILNSFDCDHIISYNWLYASIRPLYIKLVPVSCTAKTLFVLILRSCFTAFLLSCFPKAHFLIGDFAKTVLVRFYLIIAGAMRSRASSYTDSTST